MKRFTETTKWADAWFTELPPEMMLAYLYFLDNCDNAGVIDPPGRVVNAVLPLPVDWDAFLVAAGERIQVLPCGKWWLTRFIAYQWKEGVSATSKQHGPIRASIDKHGLPIDYLSNTHSSPIRDSSNRGQVKVKVKVKDKVKETAQVEGESEGEILTAPDIVALWVKGKASRDAIDSVAGDIETTPPEEIAEGTKRLAALVTNKGLVNNGKTPSSPNFFRNRQWLETNEAFMSRYDHGSGPNGANPKRKPNYEAALEGNTFKNKR